MKRIPVVSTVLSVGYATIVATGLLTITLATVALINDTSFVEYYEYIFPRFRGGLQLTRIPAWGYVVFVLYTGAAATIAAHARKRFEKWLTA